MKSKYLVAALALTLAACSNDETEKQVTNEPTAARFYGEISDATTRAAGTAWTADDAIGVTGKSGDITYTNIKYKFAEAGKPFGVATAGNTIYYQDYQSVNFTAYYPFSGTEKSAAQTVSKTIEAADQDVTNKSVESKFTPQSQIDFLYGTGTGARGTDDGKVEFDFEHKMSKLILNFTQGNEVDLNDLTQYKLDGLEMNGTFNPADGTAAANTTETTKTLTIASTDGNFTPASSAQVPSSLILFPQTASTATLTVTLDGKTYTATLTLPAKTAPATGNGLESGKKYTYNVTIGTKEMIVSEADITDWTEGVSGNDGNVDAMP